MYMYIYIYAHMAVCKKCIAPAMGFHLQCALSAPASAPTPCAPVRPKFAHQCACQCAAPVRPLS